MTRMKSLTDHLAAIHAHQGEREKKLAAQPEPDRRLDDQARAGTGLAYPGQRRLGVPRPSRRRCGANAPSCCPSHHTDRDFSCATCSTTP